MKFIEDKKWKCLDCDEIFTSTDKPYHLDYCPKCGKNAVDHEDCYVRIIGSVEEVK